MGDIALLIDILLPVYNGESYLREQLDSICEQDFLSWRVIAMDDCSTDSSLDILYSYRDSFPEQIIVHESSCNQGVVRTVSKLLKCSTAPYVALADQDDVWMLNKLSSSLSALQDIERCFASKPALVFSDLEVFENHTDRVLGSFWQLHSIDQKDLKLRSLITRNIGTGCTFLFNRALVRVLDVPKDLKVHDWWILLNAQVLGKVGMLHCKTVRYRVHSSNSIGIEDTRFQAVLGILFSRTNLARAFIKVLDGRDYSFYQARLLWKFLKKTEVDKHQLALIDSYALMKDCSWVQRKWIVIKNRFFSGTFLMHVIRVLFY